MNTTNVKNKIPSYLIEYGIRCEKVRLISFGNHFEVTYVNEVEKVRVIAFFHSSDYEK